MLLLPAYHEDRRDVPITQRLRAVLDVRKHAPDGTEHPRDASVFGNEVGERVRHVRHLWERTREAAGITGLQFRDLRREFAFRLRETPGVSEHHVRDWLGHADLATTSRYLATTRVGLQHARRVFEQHHDRTRKAVLIGVLTRAQAALSKRELSAMSVEQLEALATLFARDSHTHRARQSAQLTR